MWQTLKSCNVWKRNSTVCFGWQLPWWDWMPPLCHRHRCCNQEANVNIENETDIFYTRLYETKRRSFNPFSEMVTSSFLVTADIDVQRRSGLSFKQFRQPKKGSLKVVENMAFFFLTADVAKKVLDKIKILCKETKKGRKKPICTKKLFCQVRIISSYTS